MFRTPRTERRVAVPVRTAASACTEPLESRRLLAAALLKDINPSTLDSNPRELTDVNGTLYLSAYTRDLGQELYKTDGTASGTALVADIIPGFGGSFPRELTPTPGGIIFFTAGGPTTERASDWELWKTDGTAAGTVRVRDVRPGLGSSNPRNLTAVGNAVYFVADDGIHGPELWRSDGTEAGTVIVKDVRAAGDPRIAELTALGGQLFFTAVSEANARQVWRTDGTEAGTVLVASDAAVGGIVPNTELEASGEAVYFRRTDAEHGRELWKSDGTAAGTALVADIFPGPAGSSPHDLTDAGGGRLAFVARGDNGGDEVWRTDGTAAGTVAMTDLNPATGAVAMTDLTPLGTSVYFKTDRQELYRTDGTPATTTRVAQFSSMNLLPLVASGGKLFFAVADAVKDRITLYRTDGTPQSNVPLATFVGSYAGDWEMAPFRDGVAIAARDGTHGLELWVSDGTPVGTRLVTDLNTLEAGSLPGNVPGRGVPANDPIEIGTAAGAPRRLLYAAVDETMNPGVWSTDGTTAGTVKLIGARRDERVVAITAFGDRALFVLQSGFTAELWVTDGTPAGTRPLSNPNVAPEPFPLADNYARMLTVSGGLAYFTAARAGNRSYDLYATDGTPGGTRFVKDVPNPFNGAGPRQLTDVDGTLFFTVVTDAGAKQLWKSDGTEQGTVPLRSFDGLSPTVDSLTSAGGTLFFVASGPPPTSPRELWKSDGTPTGTVLVASFYEIGPSPWPDDPALVAVGDRVVFAAARHFGETALWSSDGTPQGTVMIKPVPGIAGQTAHWLTSAGDRAFFTARTPAFGEELWVTDGTEAGTHMVVDLLPGNGGASPTLLHAADGVLYFTASPNAAVGRELWATDGTAAGTRLVQDVNPGAASSNPALAATFGDKLAFWADDGVHGTEPWVGPHAPAPRGARVVGRRVFYNRSVYDGGNPAANSADDAAVAPDKTALLPGDAPGFIHLTSYTRGINGVMVDVEGVPQGVTLAAEDFAFRRGNSPDPGSWTAAPPPATVAVRRGAGAGGSDRYTLVWADHNPSDPASAVADGWLEVTLKATGRTGLLVPDVFALGNLVGETGGDERVTALDLAMVRRNLNTAAIAADRMDFNRDGRINALDAAAVRRSLGNSVAMPLFPPPPLPAATAGPAGARRVAEGLLG